MKVALILPNNIWRSPYSKIYSDFLVEENIEYDIISWDREGRKEDAIQFFHKVNSHLKAVDSFISYFRFSFFVKKTIKQNKYDRLIVFTSQNSIFLSYLLRKKYDKKYIIDYRDLSIEQKPFFKKLFKKALKGSYANIISSPGFKKYLPQGFDYILSHNFDINLVRNVLFNAIPVNLNQYPIDVLTIGGIRDYESNVQIIEHLANIDGIKVRFVGKGDAASDLQKRSEALNARNITFGGYYPKEKEAEYIEKATFINIFYPRKPSHDTALSNRFYNSLIYKKPMITTAHTTQGDYATMYKVGISIENCDNLPNDLNDFMNQLNNTEYAENCNKLLKEFMQDYNRWAITLKNFLNK